MNLRRLILPILLPVLFALVLPSCVFDDMPAPDSPGNDAAVSKGRLSVALRIKLTDNVKSRADADESLVDGNENEQKIGKNGNFAIFFDQNKKLYSVSLLQLDPTTNPEPEVLEKVYRASFNPDDFSEMPKYVLVLLNAPKYYEIFSAYDNTKTADDILGVMIQTEKGADPRNMGITEEGLFTMTNSTFYNKNGVFQNLTEFPADVIITPEDSPEVQAGKVINVYVERICAKFTFEVNGNTPMTEGEYEGQYMYDPEGEQIFFFDGFEPSTGVPKYIARYWKVVVTGWAPNAFETSGYLFKKLTPGNDYFTDWKWKAPEAYRTYWAEDPHYEGEYPWQYRPADDLIKDAADFRYYKDFEDRGVNRLRNYSFNDLKLGDASTFGKVHYPNENTYNYSAIASKLDDRCDYLAGTHILLGATLLVRDDVGDQKDGNYTTYDLYRDRNGIYFFNQRHCFESIMHSFSKDLHSQNSMRYLFFDWSHNRIDPNGTVYYARPENENGQYTYQLYWKHDGREDVLDETTAASLFSNFSYDMMAKGCVQYGDEKRMPWPNSGSLMIYGVDKNGNKVNLKIYSKDERTETYSFKRNATEDDVKSILYEWIGAVDHFNQGLMYYSAPAKITTVNEYGDDNKLVSSTNYCGVVRNSWYQYVLGGVSSIGTPVDDPDQPIVPYLVYIKDQINLNVKIQDWHFVPTYIPSLPQ